jgi:hypothetical protein
MVLLGCMLIAAFLWDIERKIIDQNNILKEHSEALRDFCRTVSDHHGSVGG